MPDEACSGCGTEGVQMLLRSPIVPEPALQKPNSPPMSPIPGTEQIPPPGWAGWVCAVTEAGAAGAVVDAAAGRARNSPAHTMAIIAPTSIMIFVGRRFRLARVWG